MQNTLSAAHGTNDPNEIRVARAGHSGACTPAAGRTLENLVRSAALKSPQSVAIAAPGRSPLHFGELKEHIDTLAAALNVAGIERNHRVALALPNGPDMATAFLAVSSCAACTPLNPEYTAEQFEFYLDDLQAHTLIVQAGSNSPARAAARRRGLQMLEIHSKPDAPAGLFDLSGSERLSMRREPELAGADDVALILHTSGTTARPKQVPLTHANLCASADHIATSLRLSAADRCLNVMPLFHIHGLVAAVLASLAAGGSVACAPGFVSEEFFGWLDALGPTWTTAVPTIHQAVLDGARNHRETIRRRPLRFIRSASAPMPAALAAALEACFNAPVIEAYGMTEAAHQIASNPLPPGVRKSKSVGLATGCDVAIMDDTGHLLRNGETGEIVIRGDNVIKAYENNPEANAASFTDGWFRTGDQGFIDSAGYIFITGRLKEIINRGGEKVSLREIDEALFEHAAVAQAAAFSVSHATLGEDVAAALVLKPDATASVDEIRASLFGRLADFKVPSQLIIVEAIPTGATGKIDRNRLHADLVERLKPPFVAPRNEAEAQIAAIFSEVTGTSPIGVDDNFFALGGDSLKGFRVLVRLRTALQVNLSIVDLFNRPTAAQIAREVMRLRQVDELSAIERILGEVECSQDVEANDRPKADANGK